MKKRNFISNKSTRNQKKLYLILIGLAFVALTIGILFIFIINNDSKLYLKDSLTNNFSNYKSTMPLFFKTLFNNFIYVLLIWLLGISIIGIPFVIFMFLFKYFLFGFSISSIFYSYGIRGILVSLIELFPHKIIYLIIILLISFYSLSFSIKIFKNLFLKKTINFRESMSKYLKILIISLTGTVFITLYEVFGVNYLLNFFNI